MEQSNSSIIQTPHSSRSIFQKINLMKDLCLFESTQTQLKQSIDRRKIFNIKKAQDNESTDNQDEINLAFKSINKKISISNILKDFTVLKGFFSFQAKFQLLYRASENNFLTQKFHQMCDYEANTITLCKTKDNQIIGGYTPLAWFEDFQQSKTYFKMDKNQETFLFSVTKNQKYPLVKAKKNKAICCYPGYGPTFGGGDDLQIGNKADQNYTSISYFPRSFTCQTKTINQKYFTGNKKKQFKILEWQVYKVVENIVSPKL